MRHVNGAAAPPRLSSNEIPFGAALGAARCRDPGTGVSTDYATHGNEFSGRIHWVQIDVDDKSEDLDHLITPRGALPHRDGAPVAAEPVDHPPGSVHTRAVRRLTPAATDDSVAHGVTDRYRVGQPRTKRATCEHETVPVDDDTKVIPERTGRREGRGTE